MVEDQADEAWRRMRCACVSSRGEVLAIEVKPHTASDKDIAWSVLQAGMYADLFQLWADYAGGKAHEVLHEMAGQRNRIGLSGRAGIQVAAPIKVRPESHSTAEPLRARKTSWRQCAHTWPPPVLQQTLT